jgi:ADP-heptose:LPS heptosyltransferase
MSKKTSSRHWADAAALACFVRYGSVRLGLSRFFESLVAPIVKFTGPERSEVESEPRRILVVEYWYPKAHIAILASPRVIPLLEGQGLVDEVIQVNVPWAQHLSRWKKYVSPQWWDFFRCIGRLRAKRFDLGFTARADIRDNLLLWLARVRQRVGYGFAYGESLLTDSVTPDMSRPHYCDRWLHLLEHLGKPVLDRRPELKVGQEERSTARRFLADSGIQDTDVLIGVHSGARNRVRQWGEENFSQIAQRLTQAFPVKVLWFREPGSSDASNLPGLVPVDLPLQEFLAVLSECRLLVCNDTGPMHLATALDVPVVAVFGPGMPAWWGPRSSGSRVVLQDAVWCRPCFDYCVFDQPYCLRTLDVASVFEAASDVLSSLLGKTGQSTSIEKISSHTAH